MTQDPHAGPPHGASREEWTAAVFASMVLQQTNLALMLLGKVPHPESQERLHEPDSARVLIDQLEMLEVKTRGNLSTNEERLLKQSLMTLRMAFVEAVDRPPPAPAPAGTSTPAPAAAAPAESSPAPAPPSPASEPPPASSTPPEEPGDTRKKFTKRYE